MSEAITISNDKVESKYFTYDDLQAVIKRGGKGIPINKPYCPKEFWESMGEKFYRAFDKPEKCSFGVEFFLDRIKQFQPVASLLDVGCGFGRIGPFLLQANVIEKYTGIDISNKILKCADEYLDPSVKEDTDAKQIEGFFSNGQLSLETKSLVSDGVKSLIETIKSKAKEKSSKNKVDYREKITLLDGDARGLKLESESFDCVISNECLQHLSPDDAIKACRELARVSKNSIILLERWAFPGEHAEPHIWSHNYSEIFNNLGLDVLQITTIVQGLQGVVVRKR